MKKVRSLQELEEQGLNIFNFYIPRNLKEFTNLVKRLGKVTVRFDGITEDRDDLPFYVCDSSSDSELLEHIMGQAMNMQCLLIVSGGIKCDPYLKFNLVTKIETDGSFIAEASDKKVPLRQMYRSPLLYAKGNVGESIMNWECNDYIGVDKRLVKEVLEEIPIRGKWVECTYYSLPVGQRNENLIYWQIL